MPAEMQVKLLRVLQEREFERVGGRATIKVDVRIIAATSRDLSRTLTDGTFREDLYYRLSVFPLRIPSLRERREDIPLLVHYFVNRYATRIGRRISCIPDQAMERLVGYAWPGNVRELENVIERAVILSPGPDLEIAAGALPSALETAPALKASASGTERHNHQAVPAAQAGCDSPTLRDMERHHIVSTLQRAGWRIGGPDGAARMLNVNASTLRSRMKRLGIQPRVSAN